MRKERDLGGNGKSDGEGRSERVESSGEGYGVYTEVWWPASPASSASSSTHDSSEAPSVGSADAAKRPDPIEPTLGRTTQQTRLLQRQHQKQRNPDLRQQGDHSALWTSTGDLWATERILAHH